MIEPTPISATPYLISLLTLVKTTEPTLFGATAYPISLLTTVKTIESRPIGTMLI